jgi:hypothetical protein
MIFGDRCLSGPVCTGEPGRGWSKRRRLRVYFASFSGAERAGLEGYLPRAVRSRRWQSSAAYRLKSSENHNI